MVQESRLRVKRELRGTEFIRVIDSDGKSSSVSLDELSSFIMKQIGKGVK